MLKTLNDKKYIFLDTLIYQYNFNCINKCKNCYVAKSKATIYNPEIVFELARIFSSKEIECNKFILSLSDTLSKSDIINIEYLFRVIKYISNNTTIQVSAYQYEDILAFNQELIDMISVSTLDGLQSSNKPIEYNCCDIDSELVDKHTLISKIYCISNKYNVFKHNNKQIKNDQKCIDEYLQCKEIKITTLLDNCISGNCSAGTNSMHIWPDGTVTSCPYDYQLKTSKRGIALIDRMLYCYMKSKPKCIYNKVKQINE